MGKLRNPDVLKVFRTLRGSFQAGAGSLPLPVLEVQAPLSCCLCCIRAEAHHPWRAALCDHLLRVWYGSLPASRLLPRTHDFYLGVEKSKISKQTENPPENNLRTVGGREQKGYFVPFFIPVCMRADTHS